MPEELPMKKFYLITGIVCLGVILVFSFLFDFWTPKNRRDTVSVGFIYEGDISTPATYNFALVEKELAAAYGSQVTLHVRSNVRSADVEDHLRDLVSKGCLLVLTNSRSTEVASLAAEYPEVQFCQISFQAPDGTALPENYHTFNGELWQARYVSGVAAGLKLRSLIDRGEMGAEQALVGFVGGEETPEVLSGAAAFLLGVRSQVPEAKLRLKISGERDGYAANKAAAAALLEDGCLVLANHTDSNGPAAACEESGRKVFFISLNQNSQDIAPTTSLLCIRVNYAPYVLGAVEAVFTGRKIEDVVPGRRHGIQDLSAGFDQGWVEVLALSPHLAAEGTQDAVNELIRAMKKAGPDALARYFSGPWRAVAPGSGEDALDLSSGFRENAESSYPSFRYLIE